jgi:hypothetical protein
MSGAVAEQVAKPRARSRLSRTRSWLSQLSSRPGPRRRRLETAIVESRRELASRQRRPGTDGVRDTALSFVTEAEGLLKENRLDAGWAVLHLAQRTAIQSYLDEDVQAVVISLRNECDEKLRGWRRSATADQLGKAGSTPSRENVQQAMKTLHEHSDNTYHKLDLIHDQLRVLGPTLLVALVVFAAAVVYGKYDIGELKAGDLLMVMLLGALGGALSAVRATSKGSERKIPDRLFAAPVTLLRPIVGATAATGVALVLQAGVAKLGDGSRIALLAAAFAAGFSERWFLSLMQTVTSGGTEK